MLLPAAVTACGEAGTTITRLAVGDPGPDPYTLAANADDDEQVDRRAEAGGQVKADSPGLYGGTREESSCDKDALVAFLQVNADKAKAWEGPLGIRPGEISSFVADLTPAVLRVDTLVTNHGYREGTATSMPAVLQAGIAVLVDRKGAPVVKCNCGNPLTPPDKAIDPEESNYRGASWPQFNGEKVTVIETPAEELESLTLVDSETETAFERPTGSGGDRDGRPEPIPAVARSEPPVSTSGQRPGGSPTDGSPAESPATDDGTPGTPAERKASTDPETPADTPGTSGTPSQESEDTPTEEAEKEPVAPAVQEKETPAVRDTGTSGGPDPAPAGTAPDPAGTTQDPGPPQTQAQTSEAAKLEEPRPDPEPEPGPEVTGG